MAFPFIRKNRVVLITSDACPRCAPHLVSDHDEGKCRHCNKCACVAQDVNTVV